MPLKRFNPKILQDRLRCYEIALRIVEDDDIEYVFGVKKCRLGICLLLPAITLKQRNYKDNFDEEICDGLTGYWRNTTLIFPEFAQYYHRWEYDEVTNIKTWRIKTLRKCIELCTKSQ